MSFLGFFRFFEVPKDILGHFGYIWVLMGICGFPVGLMGSPVFFGFFRFFEAPKDILGTIGFSWVCVGLVGSPGYLRFPWVL